VVRRVREEGGERAARFVLRQAVQVDLVADGVFSAAQAPQDGFRDAVAPVAQLVAGFDVEVRGIELERVGEHGRLVRAARGRTRTAALALGRAPRLPERANVAHGGAEQLAILVLDGGILRPRAAAAGLTV
jgi:hypothetical protein